MKNENNHPALLAVALSAIKALQARGADLPLRHHTNINVIGGILEGLAQRHDAPKDVKVVAYFGRAYVVHTDVKFLATDDESGTCAFLTRPEYCGLGGYWAGHPFIELDITPRDDLPRDFDYGASLVEV